MAVSLTARRVGLLVAVLTFVATGSSAGTIVWASDESAALFGFDAVPFVYHRLQESRGIDVNGIGLSTWDTLASGRAEAGPLLSLTVDFSGAVPVTTYVYDGGEFVMSFSLFNSVTGESRSGAFNAPIDGPMTFVVKENGSDHASVKVHYKLGAGVFDDSIASAFGVRSHTLGGEGDDPYLIFGTGDFTDASRRAGEGAPTVRIDVPEPASLLLVGLGLGLLVQRRADRSRRSSLLR